MSEVKFTKGEWSIDTTYTTFLCISIGAHSIAEVDSDVGEAFCGSYEIAPTVEQLANAHLIAAAPEMYHANIGAMNLLESLGMQNSDEYQALLHATKKARGE